MHDVLLATAFLYPSLAALSVERDNRRAIANWLAFWCLFALWIPFANALGRGPLVKTLLCLVLASRDAQGAGHLAHTLLLPLLREHDPRVRAAARALAGRLHALLVLVLSHTAAAYNRAITALRPPLRPKQA